MNVVLPSPRGLVCDGRFPEWDAEERQLRILPVFRLFFSSGFLSPLRTDVTFPLKQLRFHRVSLSL